MGFHDVDLGVDPKVFFEDFDRLNVSYDAPGEAKRVLEVLGNVQMAKIIIRRVDIFTTHQRMQRVP